MILDTVLVLAGGDGDRFLPLENKMCFSFNGEPLIAHIVNQIKKHARRVVIVTNKDNKIAVRQALQGCSVLYRIQRETTRGMADAIYSAQDVLVRDALILNANDIFAFSDIRSLVKKTVAEKANIGFLGKEVQEYFPGGYVRFHKGFPIEILEKPGVGNEPSNTVCLVADYYPNIQILLSKLRMIKQKDDSYELAKSEILKNGKGVCMTTTESWNTVKYPWDILSMQEFFLQEKTIKRIASTAHVHKTALIEGNVFIGHNVVVGAYSKIVGPCFIDDETTIGDYCLVRGSTIGKKCLIGGRTEIARSYLSDSVFLHQNYIGDSVISKNVFMGAGVVTANVRFDKKTVYSVVKQQKIDTGRSKLGLVAGKNVKIGINVSLYPGVKISANSIIYPGEVITKDR